MAPKRVDQTERKRQFAETALGLFSANGIEETSVDQVADAAGVSKGTVYNSFATKLDLVFAAVEAWTEKMAASGPPGLDQLSHPDPAERLRSFLMSGLERALSDESSLRLMHEFTQYIRKHAGEIPQKGILHQIVEGVTGMIKAIILDGISSGHFRPECAKDVDRLTLSLGLFFDGLARSHSPVLDRDRVLDLGRFVLDLFIERLQGPEHTQERP